MKNKLSDLHNHLFEQLERLNDESLKGSDLTRVGITIADLISKTSEVGR